MASKPGIAVTVIYSPRARDVREVALCLAQHATLAGALQASGLLQEFEQLDIKTCAVGLWGRRVDLTQVLQDGDRVEIYRALTVDPKVARRRRFVKQGARAAGLFVKKRLGAKAGY